MLLPILTDPCAASQHSYSATGLDLCYQASPLGTPVGHLLICSLLSFSVPHQNLIMPQPSRQSSSMSLPSILSFPALLERLLAASPFLCSPHGKSRFILESHREMAFVFLCYGLAIVFNHYFFPASPRTFGIANLLPFSSQHHLMIIGFHFSRVLPFDAS